MAFSITVTCDNPECHKTFVLHTVSDPKEIPDIALPRDWRFVEVNFGNIGGSGKGTVCSINCSVDWVKRQIINTETNIRVYEGYGTR